MPSVVAGCTLKNYVPFVVRAPGKKVNGVNGSLSCGELIDGVQNCTAITEGTVPLSFDFAPTVGKFYAQYYGVGSYYASTNGKTSCASYNNALTIKPGGHWPAYAAGMSIYPDSARIRRPPLPNGAIWILPNG